jgi:anti-sigma factor RsiW
VNQTCDQDRLERYASGEHSSDEGHAVVAHADACSTCRKELLQLQKERARFAARAAAEAPLPPSLWRAIERELSPPSPLPRSRPSRAPVWAGGLVAAAAGVLLCMRLAPLSAPARPEAPQVTPSAPSPAPTAVPGAALPAAVQQPGEALVRDVRDGARWTFASSAQPRVRIETVGGDVRVQVGRADAVEVEVDIDHDGLRGDGAARNFFRDLFGSPTQSAGRIDADWRLRVDQSGEEIVARVWCASAHCKQGVQVGFELSVPAGASVEVRSVAGDVRVERISGALKLNTVSGDIWSEGSRDVQIESTSGDVRLEQAAGGVASIHTVSGDIARSGGCAAGCALEIETVSGDVTLGLLAPSSFQLQYETVSGDVAEEDAASAFGAVGGGKLEVAGHRAALRVGDGKGRVHVKTVSGDLGFDQ